ncbi:MAG TPA: protein kinase, partial [Polyangiaceae bacterium]
MNATPLPRRLDRYELLAEIASGGMGRVLLARLGGAGGFQRLFAIKVLHPHLGDDPQFVEMLLEEARVAAKIHHPNVVATIDVRKHDDLHFIVMDYVDGFSLARVMDGSPFNRRERIRIVNRMLIDAMAGLEAAHELRGDDGEPLGIVHRDVSPQNILIGVDGVGRLTDFGIALLASHVPTSRQDTVKGKPSYLAPEQAAAGDVDRRADLWALGVILWEGLTGVRLFSAETEAGTVLKVVSEPIPSPEEYFPEIPADLEALCMRALDRDPARRHRSAREMAAELERVAQRSGLLADTHEVADLLRDRFGSETEVRRRAIQHYLAQVSVQGQAAAGAGHGLPKLGEFGDPVRLSGPLAERPQPVGLSTLPASRFLRTTPAGTSADAVPVSPARYTGLLALVALFGLGSLTVLVLLRFRLLDQVTPGFLVPTAAAPAARVSEPELPQPSTPALVYGEDTGPSPEPAEAPSVPPAPSVDTSAAAASVPPSPAALPPVVPSRSRPPSRKPAAAKSAEPTLSLPVEQNPYR